MAQNTGKLRTIYRDVNPNSPTYNLTRTEEVEDLTRCPLGGAEWVITAQDCELNDEMMRTGYLITESTDVNPQSTTYQMKKYDKQLNEGLCPKDTKDPNWVALEDPAPYCEVDEDGNNTGYLITTERDMNKFSDTGGETRETKTEDTVKCPITTEEETNG